MKLKKLKKLANAYRDAPPLLICDVDSMGPKMHEFVNQAEKHLPALFGLADAAVDIVDNWETGDLAGAVRKLSNQLERLK